MFAKCEETSTGMCAVLVHGKERTLCANIGASAKYPTQHLLDNIVRLYSILILRLVIPLSLINYLLIRLLHHFKQ